MFEPETSVCSKCGRSGCWTREDVEDRDVIDGPVAKWVEYTCKCGHQVYDEIQAMSMNSFAGGMGAP